MSSKTKLFDTYGVNAFDKKKGVDFTVIPGIADLRRNIFLKVDLSRKSRTMLLFNLQLRLVKVSLYMHRSSDAFLW